MAALPELAAFEVGLLHVFIQHTSASLTINENADPDVPAGPGIVVRGDRAGEFSLSAHVRRSGRHAGPCEGVAAGIEPDDSGARWPSLRLGTWQGIYLCEHRRHGGRRRLVLTLWGETRMSADD